MEIPQIRMKTQYAQIQIQQTPGKQEISQPKAELTIKQPSADISIRTTPGKLDIDQTKAWEDMNLMHIFKRNKQFAQEGKQALMEGIARRVRQGNEWMRIENGGNPLASQAAQNAYDSMKSLGIKFIPSHFAVETNYQPANVDIQVQVNKPIIDANPQKVQHHYQPGRVETSLKQHADLEIDFVNITI
ncbi:hypothetical protein D8M04_05475 [Oceanobacillus piezotolerans]|uniref:YviE n=1 Tax=Oceanobacillus piezotolerans TaxID=2448030 RepID=A0A498DCG1_9BACI|nr:DUF6470 family protein [Oceanobacillus piezotolerans]RLL46657.1 hypothetical protein D8M04_05475 [Oceanobacillus piezotolerans]